MISYRIFIAHVSEDEQLARYICDNLKNIEEFHPYLAQDYPSPGDNFKERIQNSIEDSNFFIVIMSKIALYNQWVNQELGYACAIKNIKRDFSSSDLRLKGFITRDSEDIIFSDKYSQEFLIASIIVAIRNSINKLSGDKLRFIVRCKYCLDVNDLPSKYISFLPAHEVINEAIEMGYNSWHTDCPICGNTNHSNILTWDQME